jgi:hypothetical protein
MGAQNNTTNITNATKLLTSAINAPDELQGNAEKFAESLKAQAAKRTSAAESTDVPLNFNNANSTTTLNKVGSMIGNAKNIAGGGDPLTINVNPLNPSNPSNTSATVRAGGQIGDSNIRFGAEANLSFDGKVNTQAAATLGDFAVVGKMGPRGNEAAVLYQSAANSKSTFDLTTIGKNLDHTAQEFKQQQAAAAAANATAVPTNTSHGR